ncbi:transferase [Streptomyces sp. CB03238]|uniref:transferase n=1 Tax=Streptomyces sp. CB03238 TaxID=1907777 RepID=UPI000A0FA165|nr:transferase [Streptomyces sp. CB03238]ORT60076.1 transferase [Streptomyces sp. CB03238]
MSTIVIGDYVRSATMGRAANTPYGDLAEYDLARFLTAWPRIHREALGRIGQERIHPSAFIHPTAIIGEDVIIGPDVHIHEFTTVRKGSFLAAGARIGFNCEVTACYVGEGAVLGHRIGVNRTIVGAEAHLSASVTVAAINMSDDMTSPDREIFLRTQRGLYRCGTRQFGAPIGDNVQTGNNISLGPGVAIGRRTRINSGVTLAARAVPGDSIITAPHTADAHIRRRRTPGGR